jgi:hypothetical protein
VKVLVNRCYGGFSFSRAAIEECRRRGVTLDTYDLEKEVRANPVVVAVVEELGEAANGQHAKLQVVDIPFDGLDGWEVEEYDGKEWIAEQHRTW